MTDILILLLFFLWFIRKFPSFNFQFSLKTSTFQFQSTLLILFLLLDIYFSLSPIAGLYKLLKIIEFLFLGTYIAKNVSLKKDLPVILTLFSVGILSQAGIAILQFTKQASLGGPLWLFGERMFSGQTPGIANARIDGSLILRPYGTFPHPNVLAGYLVIAMMMVIPNFKKPLFLLTLLLGTVALLLTLSRVAILLWLLILGLAVVNKFKGKIAVGLIVLLAIGSIVWFTPLSSRFVSIANVDKESYIKRQELNSAAISMFQKSPIIGIGLNNFLVELPYFQKPVTGPLWLQPAHNIYLLILAETGVVGFSFFLWFIGKTLRKIKNNHGLLLAFFAILLLGFFDHYFLTLEQGQLLLTLILGLSWVKQS